MHNVGKLVELDIARTSTGAQFQLSLFVEETTINEVNMYFLKIRFFVFFESKLMTYFLGRFAYI